jgi:hypothetical protein
VSGGARDASDGTWRYHLSDTTDRRVQCGRVAGKTGHMDVLRYAADHCRDACEPGTTERGLLERFAETGDQTNSGENHEQ